MRTRIITIITLLLSTPMVIAQKSMDEIDRESFAAKLSPMEVKGIQMTEQEIFLLSEILLQTSFWTEPGNWQKEELKKNVYTLSGQIKYLPVCLVVFTPH